MAMPDAIAAAYAAGATDAAAAAYAAGASAAVAAYGTAALNRLRGPDAWSCAAAWGATEAAARLAAFLEDPEAARLDLSECALLGLPDALRFLAPRLRSLKCSTNQLRSIPDWIGELALLDRLDFHDNALDLEGGRSLPAALGTLGRLEHLDCGGAAMAGGRLPDWMRGLKRLRKLVCSGCKLTELPDWIGELEGLETLDCSSNPLATLNPAALRDCASLSKLRCLGGGLPLAEPWRRLAIPATAGNPDPNQTEIIEYLRTHILPAP